jgi:putative aminopeptidase FrvX
MKADRRVGGWTGPLVARISALALLLSHAPIRLSAQTAEALTLRLAAMTAVSGSERAVTDSLIALLPGATRDRFGSVVLTMGSGAPRRLAYCAVDESGYVVGNITNDGYLRLRRVGRITSALFDQQLEGHRVTVWGGGRRRAVPGVVGVRSVHLTRGRPPAAAADQAFTVDDAWVDVGAASAAQVESLGIAVLAPVALTKQPHRYGNGLVAAPAAGRRAACAALATAATGNPKVAGTVVIGFAVQTQQAGRPGAAALAALHGPFATTYEVTLATRFPETSVETVDLDSVDARVAQLRAWIAGEQAPEATARQGTARTTTQVATPVVSADRVGAVGRIAEEEDVVSQLVEAYGVSGAEAPVREVVKRLLPSWARPETDSAGNLWVRVGSGDPLVAIVAHMDEIGFRIDSIRADGSLALATRGGFFPSLFEGKPALIHTPQGDVAGIFLPRDSGVASTRTPPPLRVSLGTTSAESTAALGVAAGQTITMPKQYRRLAGTRATGRSFDDRVGSASLILAMRHLDRAKLHHQVAFIWSTREEIGLEGAKAAAASLGTTPVRVHAVDTFVSADSPLEPQNFAVAPIGRGAVARALDNSSVTPPAVLDTLVRIARARGIALQVGTTNGGNDGSMFVPYGVVDVPLAWPLRYSHSPAEVIDLRDLASLADLVRAVAEDW